MWFKIASILTVASSWHATVCNAQGVEFPSTLTLRVGVLLAPPFAMLDENTGDYTGFQIELLDSLTALAKTDGVDLIIDMSQADATPPQYSAALDTIANDCGIATTNTEEECSTFDIIIGDYYTSMDRVLRVDFTPAWLSTSNSALRADGGEFYDMKELEAAGATVCIPGGTIVGDIVAEKFPGATQLECVVEDCVDVLKDGDCSLYVNDELLLRWAASTNQGVSLTTDSFNTQYLVWPLSYNLTDDVAVLLSRWIFAAVSDETLDNLFSKYFVSSAAKTTTESAFSFPLEDSSDNGPIESAFSFPLEDSSDGAMDAPIESAFSFPLEDSSDGAMDAPIESAFSFPLEDSSDNVP